ncbi:hypothetical protein FOZ63_010407 [Perkinsus olseni]|uniref:Uncharacterized protein n=1 Tax=Perkinsus olseni TaxID=32597 RepID=A0A7J6PXH9_PEROL|nr:hypothetical protein FOZ62_014314 [Perkinsus olseni]KAF4754628.1 hypothetical protein FOZ63_010407 [Perkinsus olseni]
MNNGMLLVVAEANGTRGLQQRLQLVRTTRTMIHGKRQLRDTQNLGSPEHCCVPFQRGASWSTAAAAGRSGPWCGSAKTDLAGGCRSGSLLRCGDGLCRRALASRPASVASLTVVAALYRNYNNDNADTQVASMTAYNVSACPPVG